MADAIAGLKAELGLDPKEFEDGIRRAVAASTELTEALVGIIGGADKANGAAEKMGEGFKAMGQGLAQGAGQQVWKDITEGLKAIPAFMEAAVNSAASFADHMVELGQRSGFTTTQLQEMALAAETSGLSIDTITKFSMRLTPALLSNREAFTRLGLGFAEMAAANPGDQFNMVASSLASIQDPVARLAATVEIFGKRLAPQLQPFLASMDEMKARSEELGLVWDKDTTAAAGRFKDAQDVLDATTNKLTQSFGLFIAADEDLRRMMEDATTEVGWLNKLVQELAEKFHGLPAPMKAAAAGITMFGAQLVGMMPTIVTYLGLIGTMAGGSTAGYKMYEPMIKGAKDFGASLLPVIMLVGRLTVVGIALYAAYKGLEYLGENFAWAKDVTEWIDEMVVALKEVAPALAAVGVIAVGVALAQDAMAASIIASATAEAAGTVVTTGFAASLTAASVAAKAFLLSLGPVVLIAATLFAAFAFGKWLSQFKWVQVVGDWIGGLIVKIEKLLGILPDAGKQAMSEVSTSGPGAGLKGKAFTDAIQANNAKMKGLQGESAATGPAVAEATKQQLEYRKEQLGIENQIAGIYAQRSGTIAAANQQYAQTVQMAKLDYELKKMGLEEQKAIAGANLDKLAKEEAQLNKIHGLTLKLAAAQADAAIRGANLEQLNKQLDYKKQLMDMDRNITSIQTERIGVVNQILGQHNDSVEIAKQTMLLSVEKMENEINTLDLGGKALQQKQEEIAQAVKVYDREVATADAVQKKALEEEKYTRELARGLVHAKDEKQVVAEIVAALANKKALITPQDLSTLDEAWKKARRLEEAFGDIQKKADEAFKRLETQGVDDAVGAIQDKKRRGVKVTDSDLSGLYGMRDGLSAGSEAAEKLNAEISETIRLLKDPALISSNIAGQIEQEAVSLQLQRMNTKERRAQLKVVLDLLVAEGKIDKKTRDIMMGGSGWDRGVNNVLTGLGGILGLLENIGVSADSTAGKFLAMGKSVLQAADMGKSAKESWDSGNKVQAVATGLGTVGNIIKGSKTQDAKKGAMQGAAQGAAFGAAFGPYGAAIGAIAGGLIGFFGGSKFRKIAKDAGKVLGEGLSDETVSAIEKSMKDLKISAKDAALLHIGDAMKDTGKTAHEFGGQMSSLMAGIASGSIPAKEGLAALGENFGELAKEAEDAGHVGDKVMVGLIKQSRALKIESKEIKEYVAAQLDAAVAGVHKFVAAVKILDKEWMKWLKETRGEVLGAEGLAKAEEDIKSLGKVAGVTFGAMFTALSSEKGMVAAVDELSGDFETLKKALTDSLGEAAMEQILGPFAGAFATMGNEHLRPLFEGIDGLSQAMKGLANAGFLDVDQFAAMQAGIGDMFDLAIAGGADMKTSITAVAPAIQAAISAAEQFGIPLDADTQRLKELAEQNGITFKTDPMAAMLDVLVAIAEVMGATIPDSVSKMRASMTEGAAAGTQAFQGQDEAIKAGFESAHAAGLAGLDGLTEGTRRAAENLATFRDQQAVDVAAVATSAAEAMKLGQDAAIASMDSGGNALTRLAVGLQGGVRAVEAFTNAQEAAAMSSLATAQAAGTGMTAVAASSISAMATAASEGNALAAASLVEALGMGVTAVGDLATDPAWAALIEQLSSDVPGAAAAAAAAIAAIANSVPTINIPVNVQGGGGGGGDTGDEQVTSARGFGPSQLDRDTLFKAHQGEGVVIVPKADMMRDSSVLAASVQTGLFGGDHGRTAKVDSQVMAVGAGGSNDTYNIALKIDENPLQTQEGLERQRKFTLKTVEKQVSRSLALAIKSGKA